MLCGITLSFLWSLSTLIRISLGLVRFKDTFRMFSTEHIGKMIGVSHNLTSCLEFEL